MAEPDKIRLQELANKYLKGTITIAEQAEFDDWFNSQSKNELIVPETFAGSGREHAKMLLDRIDDRIVEAGKISQPYQLWKKIAIAAIVLLILSFGAYQLLNKQIRYQIALNKLKEVGPGGDKAVLTLANGKQIVLNNTKNGLVANQGNIIINKTSNNQIIYKAPAGDVASLSYNTIATPRGGQFQVVLPDGTKVWLNSASSLKYPTAFIGKERDVTLTGEAYFEVAKNKEMPFKVATAGQIVEVLGTHFNVNAYGDEPTIKTTLLEGSVKISSTKGVALGLLHPGQQSVFSPGKGEMIISDADTSQAIAWKNGLFYFKGADVASIMKSLARWYNIDVEFDGQMPHRRFSGKIYRNVNAAQVMEIIDYSAINYKVEDAKDGKTKKKLIITP
jgi:transmembrane sensor